jgi:hypothetical protein
MSDAMLTKKEAEKKGRALLKLMKGKGWKLRVHENLGWHYNVWNGPAAVYPSGANNGKFFCLLSNRDCGGTGAGVAAWTTKGSYKDPNRAVEKEVESAQEYADEINESLEYIRGVLQ